MGNSDFNYGKAKACAMENYYKGDDVCRLVESGEYRGYMWEIRTMGSHPCAYVIMPDGHPLKGMLYDEADRYIGKDVNGGLTYGSNSKFGWDYAHCDDYYACSDYKFEGRVWIREDILEQIHACIDACIDTAESFRSQEESERERQRWCVEQIIAKAREAESVDSDLITEVHDMIKQYFYLED
jgi:hypothetical protein